MATKKSPPAVKKATSPKRLAGVHPEKRTRTTRKKPASLKPLPEQGTNPVDEDALTEATHDLMGLSIREARFVDLYLLSFNASKSYVEAGFNSKPGPNSEAASSRLLSYVRVRTYLGVRLKAMFARMEEEQDKLIRSYTYTAYADPRELVEYRRGACRYCYGHLNRFQYTAGEWDDAMTRYAEKQEKAEEAGKPMPKAPDQKGGVGYDWRKAPHPDCPECYGQGEGKTLIKDTAHLSPAALSLYAGVKQTKDGVEVLMHDQMRARDVLAKYRKLYEDGTNVNVTVDPSELEATFSAAMQRSRESMEAIRRERGLDGPSSKG